MFNNLQPLPATSNYLPALVMDSIANSRTPLPLSTLHTHRRHCVRCVNNVYTMQTERAVSTHWARCLLSTQWGTIVVIVHLFGEVENSFLRARNETNLDEWAICEQLILFLGRSFLFVPGLHVLTPLLPPIANQFLRVIIRAKWNSSQQIISLTTNVWCCFKHIGIQHFNASKLWQWWWQTNYWKSAVSNLTFANWCSRSEFF